MGSDMQTNEGFDEASRAQRATYAREGQEWDFSEDLPSGFVAQFYANWRRAEEQIDALQEQKKAMLSAVRSRHGRRQAEALKIAMRLMRKDHTKRVEEAFFTETARRYVQIIEESGYEYGEEEGGRI